MAQREVEVHRPGIMDNMSDFREENLITIFRKTEVVLCEIPSEERDAFRREVCIQAAGLVVLDLAVFGIRSAIKAINVRDIRDRKEKMEHVRSQSAGGTC